MDQRLAGLPVRALRLLRATREAIQQQRADEADQLLARAQTWAGGHPEYLRLLGVTRHLQGRPQEAVDVLRRGLEIAPGDALLLMNLGTALRATGDLRAATVALRRACELAPEHAPAWYNLGRALAQDARSGEALDAYERALQLDPAHGGALIGYGDAQRTLGRIDQAAAAYREALKQPNTTRAWVRLANMRTIRFSAEESAWLERLYAAKTLPEADRISIGFAYAKSLEDQRRPIDALSVLNTVNASKRRQLHWDAPAHSAITESILRAFSSPPATAAPKEMGREVIFIVSLPRSGSTLTEQILASHPQVEGANELSDLEIVIEAESRRTGRPFPAWVAQATPEDWRRLGQDYLDRTQRWRRDRPIFTDKALSNWRLIGAAMAMLPGARVVNCRRDPVETCFSCYRQLFAQGHAYTYDVDELASFWRDYDRAMRFWHARYPHRIRDQVLEELVQDPEAQTRGLLDFCGLPFDAACLRFHETPRNVRTVSAAQVRQPLQASGGHAARYGDLLSPLRAALGTR
ncbi:tetratricopeptide repeat-containing sulfotransferase family protein [Dokdonella sp.]|uniref:tetratricopeptide repeat-containing sulfotransferase family protein n=1 Tax=Dokdonella sp. TaxID=2291710 RepID=UPI001B068722|nr:tetratricopeptide repeat-containing sulfotransferase family protein [Dokdonella sp.]MBO9663342.1 sulfotransferase [Dokdonella sp.]